MSINFDPTKYTGVQSPPSKVDGQNSSDKTKKSDDNNDAQLVKNNAEAQTISGEVGKYVQQSTVNIVAIHNSGDLKNSSIFTPEHHQLASTAYSTNFANAKTPQQQQSALSEMKNQAQNAISKFKDLISRENAVLNKKDTALSSNNLLNKSSDPMSRQGSIFGNRNPMG